MNNTPVRAEFWKEFICTKCQFPAPERLRAQFENSDLSEFCECGCNSFKVSIRDSAKVAPIARGAGYRQVFEADFKFAEEDKSLEVILLADGNGNLAYVEIDCCGNSYPIPENVNLLEPPYHVSVSETLIT